MEILGVEAVTVQHSTKECYKTGPNSLMSDYVVYYILRAAY